MFTGFLIAARSGIEEHYDLRNAVKKGISRPLISH